MRRWLAIVVIAACGRIGFPARGDGSASPGGDANGDATSLDAPFSALLASDDFGRTINGAWGTADLGGAWVLYSPDGDTFGVAQGLANINVTATMAYGDAHLNSATALDAETRVIASFNVVPTMGTYVLRDYVRSVSSGNSYSIDAQWQPAGEIMVAIARSIGGSAMALTPYTAVATGVAAGTAVALSIRATGASPTTLCATVWLAAAPQPPTCTVSIQDSTPALQVAGISYLGVDVLAATVPVSATFQTFRYLRIGPQ